MKDHIGDDRCLQEMRDEIRTMSNLSHPNIVDVIEGYERKRHVYLIMELCTGGDLTQVEGTTERQANAIMRRVLSAVKYMHSKNVVHRDLKLESKSTTSVTAFVCRYGTTILSLTLPFFLPQHQI
jgi:serine/threonine protein kinase